MSNDKIPQFVATLAATSIGICTGTIIGWSSPAAQRLKYPEDHDDEFNSFIPTEGEFSWITASMALGAAVTCFGSGILMNGIGRKWTLLATIIPGLIGWGILLGDVFFIPMILARVFLGFSVGAAYVVAPCYVGEIAQKEIRGVLGLFFGLMNALGILFAYSVGALLSSFWLNLICASTFLVFGITFMLMPETPQYFISKDQKENAKESLKWLRGDQYDIYEELDDLEAEEEERRFQNRENSLKKSLRRPQSIKALKIIIGLQVFQQTCGISAVLSYATDIFDSANTGFTPELQTVTIGVIQIIMVIISTFIVDRLGRKILLMISSIVMALCTIAIGVFFYLKDDEEAETDTLVWLPITALSLFLIAYGIGFLTIPFVILGEVCAPDIKGISVGIALTVNFILYFLVTKFYASSVWELGIAITFWIFSLFSIGGAFFVYFALPETKGMALSAIQRMLAGNKIVN